MYEIVICKAIHTNSCVLNHMLNLYAILGICTYELFRMYVFTKSSFEFNYMNLWNLVQFTVKF